MMVPQPRFRFFVVTAIMAFLVSLTTTSDASMSPIEPSRRLALLVGNETTKASLRQLSKVLVEDFGYAKPRELYAASATQSAIRREIDVLSREAGPDDSLTVVLALPVVVLNLDDPLGQFLQTADGNAGQPWTLIPVGEIGKFVAEATRANASLIVIPQCPGPAASQASYCAQSSRDRMTTTLSICTNPQGGDRVMAQFVTTLVNTLNDFADWPGGTTTRSLTVGELLAANKTDYLTQLRQCPEWAPPFTFTVSRKRLSSTLSALGRKDSEEGRVSAIASLVELVRTETASRAEATQGEVANRLAGILLDTSESVALRSRAAWGLGQMGNLKPAVIDTMASLVGNESENVLVRTSTIHALAALGTPAAVTALRESLGRPRTSAVAGEVITALARLRDSASLPFIIKTAATGDDRLRRAALEALPAFGGTGNEELSPYAVEINAALLSSFQQPTPSVRQAALVFAASSGSFGTSTSILKLMRDDPDPKVREAAAVAVGRSVERRELEDAERQDAIRRLLASSSDEKTEVRSAALWSLGRVGGDEAVPRLLDVAKNRVDHPEASIAAIEALGALRSEVAVSELSAILLQDQNKVMLRAAAAEALGAIGSPATADALVQTVAAEMTAPEVRSAAQRALERVGANPDAVKRLKHPNASIRLETVRMIGEARNPEFASNLIVSLNDPDADVREATFVALSRVAHDSAVVQLLSATLAADEDILRRVGAARVLGSSAAPEAGSSLIAGIGDISPDVRAAVTESLLRQLGAAGPATGVPPEVRAALLRATGDPSAIVRRTSAIALGWLQDSDSAKRLQELTKDISLDVRKAAFDALARRTRLDKTAY